MSYCKYCGAYIPDRDNVCPACGKGTVEASAQASASQSASYDWSAAQNNKEHGEYKESGEYRSGPNSSGNGGTYTNSRTYGDEYDADAAENRGLGYLCYLFLFLIPLLAKPDSQFLRYHANQGLVLMLFCILVRICSSIPILGWLGGAIGSVFAFYCMVKGLGNVAHGKRSPLPVIGQITIIK
jgi:uncharacterized membrane protein